MKARRNISLLKAVATRKQIILHEIDRFEDIVLLTGTQVEQWPGDDEKGARFRRQHTQAQAILRKFRKMHDVLDRASDDDLAVALADVLFRQLPLLKQQLREFYETVGLDPTQEEAQDPEDLDLCQPKTLMH